jgi:hypothetical protein
VSSGDVGSSDINPNIGITGTPVIDPGQLLMYLSVKTKETIGGATYFVQRMHVINIADGTDVAQPFLIGETTNGNTNTTPIWVHGGGDGHVTDTFNAPYGLNNGQQIVQFNALREANRAALTFINNTVYEAWASHGDQGPYHGWVVAWDVSHIRTTGFVLKGVFNTTPNGGLAGIWQGSGHLAFENDGSAFFFETGNGPGGHGNPSVSRQPFTVTAQGSGYTNPTVTITDPTGTRATATATVSGGKITALTITHFGTGYSANPTITITDPTGSGAHATATVINGGINDYGLPSDGDYYEALVKVVADTTHASYSNQNINGWGLQAVDYFIPYNQVALDNADRDFGSGAPMILPDNAGNVSGHPHMMVSSGKEGKIYLTDRETGLMGGFHVNNDAVVNVVANQDGAGINSVPVQVSASLSTPAYFNGMIYWTSGYSGSVYSYRIGTNGRLTTTSQSMTTFGYLPGSAVVSANGTTNGVVWVMDTNANQLHAYDATTMATELWNTGQKAGGADNLGAAIKFATPAVANGQVFVGTSTSLVVYGLTPPSTAVPNAPVLTATTLSASTINLTWTDSTQVPNQAASYTIQISTDGSTFSTLTTAPGNSTQYSVGGLSPNTTYYFRIYGTNSLGNGPPSSPPASATTAAQTAVLDFSAGFNGSSSKLQYNGTAGVSNNRGELTTAGVNEAGSFFSLNPVDVTGFSTQFNFLLTNANAEGITFTIQNNGPTALGPAGGGLGYGAPMTGGSGGIPNSVAIKFDLANTQGEGTTSTGLYTNGAAPTNVGSIDLSSTLNFHSGHTFQVNMTYDGTTLAVIIKDLTTNVTATQNYTVNIPGVVGANNAYVGFTGATGSSQSAQQDITYWTYTPNTAQGPNFPTALGAVPATATSVNLTWTNNANNQTGFHLDRATDAAFTQNLITQTLPATPFSFTDTAAGLAPGSTFYYRLRAFNNAGDSANSSPASVTIPLAPAKPTNAVVTDVSTTDIDLSWTDNAGINAQYYAILREVGNTGFIDYIHLPPLHTTPPSTYTWSDTGLTPRTYYEYHIEAVNTSGHNDFVGTNAVTLTSPPTGLTTTGGPGVINLSWTAPPLGTQSYNVYRSTTPGGEGTTPLVTGLTTTTYADTSVAVGVTYYYTVTSVNVNNVHVPPIPYESAASNEASAASRFFSHFGVTAPATATAGTPVSVTVTALDQLNSPFPSYGGTVHLTSSDGAASLQADAPLTNGVSTFNATLRTVGNQWITASDSVNIGQTGASGAIAVAFGTASKVVFLTQPTNTVAGAVINPPLQVAVEDSFGNIVTTDSSNITVAIGTNPGSGMLSGTLTIAASNGVASFGTLSINNSGTGYTLTLADGSLTKGTSSAFNVVVPPATQLAFTVQPTSTTAGLTLAPAVQVTVEDQFGHVVTADNSSVSLAMGANLGGGTLGGTLTVAAVNGVATFSNLSINQSGSGYTLTAADGSLTSATSSAFNIAQAVVDHLALSVPASATAGSSFLVTVTAQDTLNQTVVGYNGTVQFTSTDPQAPSPAANITLSNGVGYAVATLGTAGSATITARDTVTSIITGTSTAVTVSPGTATHLTVSGTPATLVTGSAASFTVTALDLYNNTATGYTGTVTFSSSDSAASFAPGSYTFAAGDAGVHNFTGAATLNTAGSQTITATDADTRTVTGTSSAIAVRGLTVQSVTVRPYGVVVTFSKGFDPSTINLYGIGAAQSDVVLVGATAGIDGGPGVLPNGSLLLNTTTNTLTWIYTYGMLPDDTYTLTLVSGANAFKDLSGVPLDGNNSGVPGTNYSTTFITSYNTTTVGLVIPSFARGPGQSVNLIVPNSSPSVYYGGIPIQLTDGNNATSATFSITYTAALLNVSGATVDPHTPAGSTFARTSHSVIGGFATDGFTINTNSSTTLGTGGGPVTLGELTATVPNTNGQMIYKSKRLLNFSSLSVIGQLPVVGVSGLEVVAYADDASGDGAYAGNDAALVGRVAGGQDTGFAAFRLVDPALIADIAGEGIVTANSASQIAQAAVHRTVPNLAPIPAAAQVLPSSSPDPTLSLPANLAAGPDGTVTVPVNIDNARPAGSPGLTEATLALRFDPNVLTVSPADIHLGNLPLSGSGWTLTSSVDNNTGQLGITLYSLTPITTSAPGSLVTIDFHERGPGALVRAAPVHLVGSVDPNSQGAYRTNAADENGALILSPAPTQAGSIGSDVMVTVAPGIATAQEMAVATTSAVLAPDAPPADERAPEEAPIVVAAGSPSSIIGENEPSLSSSGDQVGRAIRSTSPQNGRGAASLSGFAGLPLPGLMFQFGNLPMAGQAGTMLSLEQHLADRLFLALAARGTGELADQALIGGEAGRIPATEPSRLLAPAEFLMEDAGLPLGNHANTGTDWLRVMDTSLAASTQRKEAPPVNPPPVDAEALSQYFARVATDDAEIPDED